MTTKTPITEMDYVRLSNLAKAVGRGDKGRRVVDLAERLRNSIVFKAEVLTDTFVRMNSAVTIRENDGGEAFTYRLVFPVDADIQAGRISVLSPLGAALLGRKEGEVFTYESPGGKVEVRVEKVENEG
jgi:regulator of nucleoside diphosphate kinase